MSVSFQATLAEPLKFGQFLEICGKVPQHATRLAINLAKQKVDSCEETVTDLHITIDFERRQIYFTQPDTDEIRKDFLLVEFLNEFKLLILMAESKYYIALNQKNFINFEYNNSNISNQQSQQTLKILGELEYLKKLDHRKYFPYMWPAIQIAEEYLDFSNDQPMIFKPGHVLNISARLEGNSKGRFIIQFRHAHDHKRQELHISVRFDTRKIVRNSKCIQPNTDKLAFDEDDVDGFTFLYSRFGQEEDDGDFPFDEFGKPFKLAVAFCETKFKIAKDGKFLFDFAYRSPNILKYIMGPKIFGTNGVNVRVHGIDHLPLEDALCNDFEKLSSYN